MKKILVMLLALVMIVSLVACNEDDVIDVDDTTATTAESTTEDATTTEKPDDTDPSDDDGDDALMDTYPEQLFVLPAGQPTEINPRSTMATKFTVTGGSLSSIAVPCPGWNDRTNGENVGTLWLFIYEWAGDDASTDKQTLQEGYAATLATKAIAYEEFPNYSDNETLTLWLDDYNLPEEGGTYLFVVMNPDEENNGVGVYTSSFNGASYYNDIEGYGLPYGANTIPEDRGDYDPEYKYAPVYTSNIVSFNTYGTPTAGNYMEVTVDIYAPIVEDAAE